MPALSLWDLKKYLRKDYDTRAKSWKSALLINLTVWKGIKEL